MIILMISKRRRLIFVCNVEWMCADKISTFLGKYLKAIMHNNKIGSIQMCQWHNNYDRLVSTNEITAVWKCLVNCFILIQYQPNLKFSPFQLAILCRYFFVNFQSSIYINLEIALREFKYNCVFYSIILHQIHTSVIHPMVGNPLSAISYPNFIAKPESIHYW